MVGRWCGIDWKKLPEIGFDLTTGGSGNINPFSRNIVGVDKYDRTKPYTLIDGTSTLPRNITTTESIHI